MKTIRHFPILVLLAFSLAACGGPQGSSGTATERAWSACEMFVEKAYDIPFLDAPRFTGQGVTHPAENEFTVEVFYPKHSTTFVCSIQRLANGNWKLLSLDQQ